MPRKREGYAPGMRARVLAALVLGFVLIPAAEATATQGADGRLGEYAQRTWASLVAMTDPRSGLPADILNADGTTSVQTSTTNIGAYMWSGLPPTGWG